MLLSTHVSIGYVGPSVGPGVGGAVCCKVGTVLGPRLGAVDGERDGDDDVGLPGAVEGDGKVGAGDGVTVGPGVTGDAEGASEPLVLTESGKASGDQAVPFQNCHSEL